MKENVGTNDNFSKRLYYKRVATILLVSLIVFFSYNLMNSIKQSLIENNSLDNSIRCKAYDFVFPDEKVDNSKQGVSQLISDCLSESLRISDSGRNNRKTPPQYERIVRELEDAQIEKLYINSSSDEFYDI